MRYSYKIAIFILSIITIISFAGYLNAAGLEVPVNNKVDFNTGSIVVPGDITNAGTLQASTGSIKLDGNWTNTGTFNAGSIGTVEFTGSTASTITGDNAFVNFTCTQAGKQLNFEAGKTQTIAGAWTLTGASGNLVTLRSTVAGTQWVVNPATRNISFVDVKDSNNLSATVIDPSNSTDSGNNTKWFSDDVAVTTTTTTTIPGETTTTSTTSNTSTTTTTTPTLSPIIDNFSPTSAAEGQTVIIEGSSLSGAISVTFGGEEAAAITFNTSTNVSATVGKGNSGEVCVTTSAGKGCKSGFLFDEVDPPEISTFSPTSGTKGDTVVIMGKNLSGGIIPGGVTIGGAKASEITVISETRIAAVIGNCNPAGDENVCVTTSKGSACKSGFICIPCSGNNPIADFIASRTKGKAPLIVKFTDTSQNNPTSWRWDFGDGGESTASCPTHTYQTEGNFTVTLEISNGCGEDNEIKNDFIQVK